MTRRPPDPIAPSANSTLDTLRRRFRANLPDRLREIEQATDPAVRVAALHRLAGAAGSFGFDELGAAARAAERLATGPAGPELDIALAEVGRLAHAAIQK